MSQAPPSVRLLGAPEVVADGAPVNFDTRKALGILAYIAVEGPTSRDTLTGLFWLDSPPDRARATFRRTLSSLRSGVGSQYVAADRQMVDLVDFGSDLNDFRAALAETSTHAHNNSDVCVSCVAPLARAIGLHRGRFLEGFTLKNAPLFEDWQRSTTEDLNRELGTAHDRLANALAMQGEYESAIAVVSRWLEVDPLDEPAHRLHMLLHAWAGDRPGAIASYRDCVAALDRELAVTPLAETSELYEAILDEDIPPAPSPPEPTETAPARTVPSDLIDRREELRRLRDLLHSSRTSTQVVCLSGGPWMGKTRLIEELTQPAEDHLVLLSRAYRMEEGLPYGVVSQLLTDPRARDIVDSLPDWVGTELARIVPYFGPGPPPEFDPGGGVRLMEAMVLLLRALSETSPTVIVVDDVQWMDPVSTALISYLATRLRDESLMLLLALRPIGSSSPELRALVELAEMIELASLEPNDIEDLVDDPAEVIEKTNGVPLLIAEHLTATNVSGAMDDYVQLRAEGVSGLARQVLGAASVLAGYCEPELLRRVSGRSDGEYLDAIDELLSSRLLKETKEPPLLTFTFDAVADHIYEQLSMARRRLLHGRVGEALADKPTASSDARLAALVATHFREAGRDEAAPWYLQAGDLARAAYANQEAIAMFEAALALGGDESGNLQLAIGEVAMASGDYQKALAHLTTGAALADGETLAHIEHRLGEVNRLLGRFESAARHLERAVAEQHPDPAAVYADHALLAQRMGDHELALAMGQKALEVAEDNDILSRVHNVNGAISRVPEQALAHLDIALQLANGDPVSAMTALNNKARLFAGFGEYSEAIGLIDEATELAADTGRRHHEAALRDFLADLHYRSGDVERARELQTESMALFAEIDRETSEPELWQLSRW